MNYMHVLKETHQYSTSTFTSITCSQSNQTEPCYTTKGQFSDYMLHPIWFISLISIFLATIICFIEGVDTATGMFAFHVNLHSNSYDITEIIVKQLILLTT
jgi:hypothetical protein